MRSPCPQHTFSVVLCILATSCHKLGSSGDPEGSGAAAGPAAALPPSLAFLNGFEGEIDAVIRENKAGEAPVPVEVFVKGDRVRVDVPERIAQSGMLGPKAYFLFDSPAKKLSIVSDAQKQVIVVDLNKSGEQLKGFTGLGAPPPRGGAAPQGPTAKLTKTGKFDTVAGYACENWDVTSDHREATICVADQGASWFRIPMTGIPTERLWMAELLDGKHFPLRAVSYGKDGATEGARVEVTKIDKKSPAAAQFEYPPSYRVVDLGQMFHALSALPSGLPMAIPPPPAKAH